MKKNISLPLMISVLLSCSKPVDYMYQHPVAQVHSYSKVVSEFVGGNKLDILWLIGGMTEQETNFTNGVGSFMTSFLTRNLSWRMAVTSDLNAPQDFLGLASPFDSTDPSPVNNLVSAVSTAVNYRDDEVVFDPIATQLAKYPQFLRKDALLVVIMTNDNPDESETVTTAPQMLSFLQGLKGGDPSKVLVYGVFGATDLGCPVDQIDADWNFNGTEFDTLIQKTGGQVYSLCDNTFGAQLSKIADNVYQHLQSPKIVLATRPIPKTIRISYHGTNLPGGPESAGGYWYYDVKANTVVFYNLNFINGNNSTNEAVDVQYTDDSSVQ